MFGFIQKIVASVGLLVASIFGFNQAPEITPTPEPTPIVEITQSPSPSPIQILTPTPIIKYIVITPTPTPIPVYSPILTPFQDNSLKVAQCQADSRNRVAQFINLGYQMAEDKLGQQVRNAVQLINNLQALKLSRCYGYDPNLRPQDNLDLNENCRRSYDQQISETQYIKQDWELKLQQGKAEVDRLAEQEYNRLYLQCLNK